MALEQIRHLVDQRAIKQNRPLCILLVHAIISRACFSHQEVESIRKVFLRFTMTNPHCDPKEVKQEPIRSNRPRYRPGIDNRERPVCCRCWKSLRQTSTDADEMWKDEWCAVPQVPGKGKGSLGDSRSTLSQVWLALLKQHASTRLETWRLEILVAATRVGRWTFRLCLVNQ